MWKTRKAFDDSGWLWILLLHDDVQFVKREKMNRKVRDTVAATNSVKEEKNRQL